ncbi:MAG: zinc-binding dehydrogenase [Actinocatenispora sp.]
MIPATRRVARATRPGLPREVVEVVREEIREPAPGHVLVRVAAAAVNHSELLALRGGAYAEGLAFPVDLGYEGAGTVVAVAGGAGIEVGARVCWGPAPGSCADHVALPAAALTRVPDDLDLTDAARLPSAGLTAHLLARVWPLRDRTAVVWGAAGPVGRILTAVLAGAGTTVVGVASGSRVDEVRAIGAIHVVDRSSDDVAGAVRALTDGRGVDAVFDPVGAATYRASLDMLGFHGCLVNYGQLSGELPTVDLTELMDKGVFVTKFGGGGSGLDGLDMLRELTAATLELARRNPRLVADAGERYRLDDAAVAYQRLRDGSGGKVVVVPD